MRDGQGGLGHKGRSGGPGHEGWSVIREGHEGSSGVLVMRDGQGGLGHKEGPGGPLS